MPEILVNVNVNSPDPATTAARQITPRVAFDYAHDEIIIAWRDADGQDGSGSGAYARVMDNNSFSLIGDQFRINILTNDHQLLSDIGVSPVTGEFYTICNSLSYADEYDVIFRKFARDSTGAWIGSNESMVNTYTSFWQWAPSLLINNTTGEYIVSWTSDYQDGSGRGAYSAIFDKNNNIVKPEFRVSIPSQENQFFEKQIWDEASRHIIYFYSYSSGFFATVRYQIYDQDFNPVGGESPALDVNGTEINTSNINNSFNVSYDQNNQRLNLGYNIYSSMFGSTSKSYFRQFRFIQPNICAVNGAFAGNDTTLCKGESVQLGFAPVTGANYSWSPSTGLNNSNISNPTATPDATTMYVVTASTTNCTRRDTVIITVNNVPSKPVIVMNSRYRLCAGDMASFSVFNPQAGVSYQWYQDGNPVSTSINFTTTTEGNVSYTASDNGCISLSSEALPVKYWSECPHSKKAYSLNPGTIDPSDGQFKRPLMYVYTKDGDSLLLDDIAIQNNSPIAGIFHLHFTDPAGAGFNDVVDGPARQQVVIQVFRDLSRLLSPTGDATGLPQPYTGQAPQIVEIQIRQVNIPGALAGATQYYLEALGTTGIAYGDVWKVINTGVDPYAELSNVLLTPANGFYHGEVQVSFAPGINWYTASQGAILPTQSDMYTVILHEVMHMLGFASLLDQDGSSLLRPGNYALFDTYLNAGGQPVVQDPTGIFCYTTSYGGQDLTPGCGITFNGGNVLNHAIFSPVIWQPGSSLSHFNCATNTAGYVMNQATPPGFMQRTLHPDEAASLCDLMYNLTGQFGDLTDPQSNTATYTTCNATIRAISGVNDFRTYNVNNTGQVFTVSACSTLTFGRNDILANDRAPGSTVNLSCLQIVDGGGSLASITNDGFIYTPDPAYVGQAVLRYRPQRADNGERGNTTYILINVIPCQLAPCSAGTCNFICQGDFENVRNGLTRELTGFSWEGAFDVNNNSPDLFLNGCFVSNGICNMPSWASCGGPAIPFPAAQSGSRYIGMYSNGRSGDPNIETEGIVFNLGTNQLLPNRNYRFSFFAQAPGNCNPTMQVIWADEAPCSTAALNACPGFTPVATNSIVITQGSQWRRYVVDFCVPAGSNPISHVFMRNLATQLGVESTNYFLLDNVSLTEYIPLTVTQNVSGPNICPGGQTTINYSVCMAANCLSTNIQNINLQVNLPSELTISGGNFTGAGTFQIPANSLSAVNPCRNNISLIVTANNNSIPNTNLAVNLQYLPQCNNNPAEAVVTTNFNVSTPPPASITANGPTSVCQGQSVTLQANTGVGLTYQWLRDNNVISGATNASYTATVSGNYSVSVNNSVCTANSNIIPVTIIISPTPSVAAGGPTTFCQGQSVTLTANPNGTSYQWYSSVVSNAVPVLIPGATSKQYVTTASGFYRVQITYSTGCSAMSTPVNLIMKFAPIPIITLSGPTSFCPGGSVKLTANGGGTYQWYRNGAILPGQTNASITVSTNGNYTARVTGTNGCAAMSEVVNINNNTACCRTYRVNAQSTLKNPILGNPNSETLYSANGGTMVFDGIYHVVGTIGFSNGTFRLNPGTIFYFDGYPTQITPPEPPSSDVPSPIFPDPYLFLNAPLPDGLNHYLALNRANLIMNKATMTANCDDMWGGVYAVDRSTISMTDSEINHA